MTGHIAHIAAAVAGVLQLSISVATYIWCSCTSLSGHGCMLSASFVLLQLDCQAAHSPNHYLVTAVLPTHATLFLTSCLL